MRERWFVLRYSLRRQEQTSGQRGRTEPVVLMYLYCDNIVDDDVYYYMCWRLNLEGETDYDPATATVLPPESGAGLSSIMLIELNHAH